jgi:acyl-CoA synthetase (AMP-forming)/AMP-acid ligase II
MALRQVTLGDVLRRNAQFFPQRTAIVCGNTRISHRDYLARSERLAAGLVAQGIKAGDRIAIAARNCLELTDLYGAAALTGAIVLPVNWRLNADEMAYVLADGEPALIIAGPEDQPTIAGIREKLPSGTKYFGISASPAPFRPFGELTDAGALPPQFGVNPHNGYVIIHTAAVDGRPRGALISQVGLIYASIQLAGAWQLDERDVALVAVPLFHVTGLGQMLASQFVGGSSVIMPKFDPAECASVIAAEQVTIFAEFAPMLMNLLDKATETGASLKSLRAVLGLDTADTIARFEKEYPDARFWAVYGQSETSGLVTLSRWRERLGSAGRPLPLVTLALVDETDQPVATGQVGEIVVRSPMVFCGYWRREADNAFTFRNGWHYAGPARAYARRRLRLACLLGPGPTGAGASA